MTVEEWIAEEAQYLRYQVAVQAAEAHVMVKLLIEEYFG
jgi:hypothetical protein